MSEAKAKLLVTQQPSLFHFSEDPSE
jgi:hypothetical protein